MDPTTQEPPEASYELTLEGEGVTVRRSIDASVAATILQMVVGGGVVTPVTRAAGTSSAHGPAAVPQPAIPGAPPAEGLFEELSPGEYVDEVEAKRNPDKIVAFASWINIYQGQETFTSDEIKELFDRAGEVMPKNFSRDFRWAQQVRWITESMQEKGSYRLTKRGKQAIDERFSSEIIKASRQPARRSRGSNGSNNESDDAEE